MQIGTEFQIKPLLHRYSGPVQATYWQIEQLPGVPSRPRVPSCLHVKCFGSFKTEAKKHCSRP